MVIGRSLVIGFFPGIAMGSGSVQGGRSGCRFWLGDLAGARGVTHLGATGPFGLMCISTGRIVGGLSGTARSHVKGVDMIYGRMCREGGSPDCRGWNSNRPAREYHWIM